MKKFYCLIIFIILFSRIPSIAAQPVIRWAADAEGNAPYIFLDPQNLEKTIGFEVDFAELLAKQMGRKPVFFQNQWDGLIPGLERNDYDIAVNGLEITPEHQEGVAFSVPYYATYEQLIIRGDNYDYLKLEDLKGKSIGVLKGALAEKILREKEDYVVKSYESEVLALEDLKNNRISAVLVDAPIALYYASWNKDYKLIGDPIGEVYYGIACKQSDTLLAAEVNHAVKVLISNGKLRKLYEHWNLWNPLVAKTFGDFSVSKIEPSRYKYWVKTQLDERSVWTKIGGYVKVLPMFAKAALVTLGLAIVSMMLAVLLALPVVLGRVYGNPLISRIAMLYIEIIRGTPLLVQLLIIFYALPMIGIKLSPFLAAVIGLGMNYSAYEAENYRSGIKSVPKGQMEAALVLGMSRLQAIRHIIIPQAFRIVIPPLTNDFIALLKDSSLVSVITMVELTKVYNQTAQANYDFFGMGIICAIFYLLLGLPFIKLSKKAEKKLEREKIKI